MKYFKRDGKLFVQCLDGELELPINHLETLKHTANYFEKAIKNSKGKNWTIGNLPKELLHTKIKIDSYLETLRGVIDTWHEQHQNKEYLILLGLLINEADMEISNPLLEKKEKDCYEYLFKGLKAIRDFYDKLPLSAKSTITGLQCLNKFKEIDLKFIFRELMNARKLHKSVLETNFVGAFQGAELSEKIHWIGSNPKLATLVNSLTGLVPEESLITKLFKTEKQYNRMAERRTTDKFINDLIIRALK
jgi:hypothetical protein